MSVSDRHIQATALLVFKHHGRSASYYARGRMHELRDQGVHSGAKVWKKIAAICEECERGERQPGEPVN